MLNPQDRQRGLIETLTTFNCPAAELYSNQVNRKRTTMAVQLPALESKMTRQRCQQPLPPLAIAHDTVDISIIELHSSPFPAPWKLKFSSKGEVLEYA